MPHNDVLTNENKATFYSDWKFSAIRLACGLDDVNSSKDLERIFRLNKKNISPYLEFLLETGLVVKEQGKLSLGPNSTHLSKDSPFVKNHHKNWRLRAIETIDRMSAKEVMYSAPMCISKKDFENLSTKVLSFIEEFVSSATESSPENLYFLNIDLRSTLDYD